jgi:Amt family ammonium transporter
VAEGSLFLPQFKAAAITLVLALVGTLILAFVVKAVLGLRPTEEVERQGLDINEHGEEGYSAA